MISRYLKIPLFAAVLFLGADSVGSNWTGGKELPVPSAYVEFTFEPDPALTDTSYRELSGNVAALEEVFGKLRALRRGGDSTVTILHVGDSHIQAGYFPGTLREHFQSDFGNAGRGLITPLKLTGTNEPVDYAITSPNRWSGAKCADWTPAFEVGIGGMAISTGEKNVAFTITSREPFDRITTFHHPKAPMIWEERELSTGMQDFAVSEEATHIGLNRPVTTTTIYAPVVDPDYAMPIFYGFSLENGQSGVLYHSVGINGASSTLYNRNPKVIERFAALEPDLVVISLGTNDGMGGSRYNEATCRREMETLVLSVIEQMTEAAVLLTTPMESTISVRSNTVNKNIVSVRRNIVDIATELGLPYWDFYTAAGGEGAIARWRNKQMAASDRIHLTQGGYTLQGDMLYNAFINSYNFYGEYTALDR